MNAYELADELAECIIDGSTDLVCVAQAANMLRQQADRIAELEKKKKPLSDEEIWDWFRKNTALTKESALRIARAIEERHGIK